MSGTSTTFVSGATASQTITLSIADDNSYEVDREFVIRVWDTHNTGLITYVGTALDYETATTAQLSQSFTVQATATVTVVLQNIDDNAVSSVETLRGFC